MGWCGGANAAINMPPRGPGFGMGRGGGWGGGWRHRHWYHATGLPGWQRAWMGWPGRGASIPGPLSKEQELVALKQQAASLGQVVDELNARIQELEKPVDATSFTGKEDR
jgi:hypothetical protein